MISTPQYRVMNDRAAATNVDSRTISRYGVVFNSDSYPLYIETETGEYIKVIERITAESVADADMEDMICARNHDFDKVLGRLSNKTMRVEIDETGIRYTTRVCKTSYGDDTLENVRRADIEGSSFVFMFDVSEGYTIEQRENGDIIATPNKITKILEMGPVTKPAYPGTIQNRSDELVTAVQRFLKEKDEKKTAKRSEGKPDKKKDEGDSEPAARAMDMMDLMELVTTSFYREFDGTDEMYYYIQSVAVDNTLVTKEYPTRKLYRVEFQINENDEVTFSEKNEWVQVKKEYLPVTNARSFYDALNEQKRRTDEPENAETREETPDNTNTTAIEPETTDIEQRTTITYPDYSYYKSKAIAYSSKNKMNA